MCRRGNYFTPLTSSLLCVGFSMTGKESWDDSVKRRSNDGGERRKQMDSERIPVDLGELIGRTETEKQDAELINMRYTVRDALEARNEGDDYSYEPEPEVFHASQAGMCKRQMFISKMGLQWFNYETQGTFLVGTKIHEWMENEFSTYLDEETGYDVEHERPVSFREDGLKFIGRADFYNPDTGRVVDFKTTGSRYSLKTPKMSHIDQVLTYIRGIDGADKGSILYLLKKNLETVPWPSGHGAESFFEFHEERWNQIKSKCQAVHAEVVRRQQRRGDDEPVVKDVDDLPFERCGECYGCRNEEERIKNNEFTFLQP